MAGGGGEGGGNPGKGEDLLQKLSGHVRGGFISSHSDWI